MLDSITRHVKSIASDAFSSVKSSINASSRTTTADAASTSDVDATKTTSSLERDADTLTSRKRGPYTSSVGRFMRELEQEEEEIKHFKSVPGGKTERTQRSLNTPSHYRPDRSDERRALGVLEKSPSDAIKIIDPMSKSRFLVGPYQPHDSLKQPISTRGTFYEEHKQKSKQPVPVGIRKEQYRSQKSGRHEKPEKRGIRDNNHERPSKRPRNGPSPMKGASESYAIDIDDSQDGIPVERMSLSPNTSVLADRLVASVGGLARTPSRIVVNVPPGSKSDLFNDQRIRPVAMTSGHRTSNDSPDELFDNGDDDDAFMRNARHQRLEDEDVEPATTSANTTGQQVKTRFDSMLSSSPVVPPTVTEKDVGSTPHRKLGAVATKKDPMSKIERRFRAGEESPDALQGDATTIRQRSRSISRTQHLVLPSSSGATSRFRGSLEESQSTALKRSDDTILKFPLSHYEYHDIPCGKEMLLTVNKKEKAFALEFLTPLLSTEPVFRMLGDKIMTIYRHDEDAKPRIMIKNNDSKEIRRVLVFEFVTHDDLHGFCEAVMGFNSEIRLICRDESWMTGVFETSRKRMQEYVERRDQKAKRLPNSASSPAVPYEQKHPVAQRTDAKKERLVDRLDAPVSLTIISGADRSGSSQDFNRLAEVQEARGSKHRSPKVIAQPVHVLGHSTRSMRSRSDKFSKQEEISTLVHPKKESEFDKLQRWKKPLVYPSTGKKRETVQFDDLQRLDDDEFLNDNLVSLFIRYLEEHAEVQNMKRIHVFNSFLFEALTKDVKTRREINYDAVKRWTAKVDIFNRDFIVVPVNEHLHWFVMIVCNLSYFRHRNTSHADDEGDDNEVSRNDLPTADDAPLRILQSDLEEGKEASARDSFAEMTIDDQQFPLSDSHAAKPMSGNRGRKKARRSLPKYDTEKPVIITLDSLGTARSTTASVLRQYIVAEAKDKHGWDIDGNDIKGMTAKDIPAQNNFSDCGLYLCMYLEQFFRDPYAFIHGILQRTSWKGWPVRTESSDLRKRLREMLLKLHQLQNESRPVDDIPPLGSILVNAGKKNKVNETEDHDSAPQIFSHHRHENLRTGKSSDRTIERDEPVAIDSIVDWQNAVNNPIEVDDADDDVTARPDSPGLMKRTEFKSRYFFEQHSQPYSTTNAVHRTTHDDPAALAQYLERQRSPERAAEKATAGRTRSEKATAGRTRSEKATAGRTRSISASTSYLTSNESYDVESAPARPVQSSPDKLHRRAHMKFKKHDSPQPNTLHIEDEDTFHGFSDPATGAEDQDRDHDTSHGKGNTSEVERGRRVLRDITESKQDGVTTAYESSD